MYQFYLMAWWSYIIFIDAVLTLKTGHSSVFDRRFPWLATMSCAFWCLFELQNVRLQNWFYINIPSPEGIRFTGYFLAFGTVIPAIYLTTDLLNRILPEMRIRSVPLNGYGTYAIPLGVLCLFLSLAFPVYCFSLAWVFLAFTIDGYNYRKGYTSLARDLESGSFKRITAVGLAGMICGLFWEFWNYWAITKWVYTVPFFERFKLFEMPAPGFLGFAFFALETMAFLTLLESSPFLVKSRWVASACAVVFSVLCFLLIDHYTVFSRTARASDLPFLTAKTRELIAERGIETSYAIDPALLNEGERQDLALLDLKGLGLEHFTLLSVHGVETIDSFSRLDQYGLASIMKESNLRRIRVYMRAERDYQISGKAR